MIEEKQEQDSNKYIQIPVILNSLFFRVVLKLIKCIKQNEFHITKNYLKEKDVQQL